MDETDQTVCCSSPSPTSTIKWHLIKYKQWETVTTPHPKMIQNLILPVNLKLTFQINKHKPPMRCTILDSVRKY